MNLFVRAHLLMVFLLLSLPSLAVEPFPLTDLATLNAEMGKPLKGLMDDYVELLPAQTRLSVVEPEKGYASHSWSANYDALSKACHAQPAVCSSLLQSQFDILAEELTKGGMVNLRGAILLSAEADMCRIAVGAVDMGYRCLNPNLNTWTSFVWQSLGYDHLFLAYEDIDQASRNQMKSWLAGQESIADKEREESIKRLDTGFGGAVRSTQLLELRDSLSAAYSGWLLILLQQIEPMNQQNVLTSLTNLSRISTLQGHSDWSDQWWKLSQSLLVDYPEISAANQCQMQSTRFILDVEHAYLAKSPFDGVQRIQELIDKKCPFTAQALNFSIHAFKQQQTIQALEVLKVAQAECNRERSCLYDRKQQIDELIIFAQGTPAILRKEAQRWMKKFERFDEFLSTERQIVWLLADRLYAIGAKEEAVALYKSLDDQIDAGRDAVLGGDLKDLEIYDELKRIRVRLGIEQGEQILPMQSESLRGQTLLARLRLQRWQKELSVSETAADRAALEEKLAQLESSQNALKSYIKQASPLMHSIVEAMLSGWSGLERSTRIAHLNMLAARQENTNWMTRSSALFHLKSMEGKGVIETPLQSLKVDEAYLSWLHVPGGYVGTLMAVNKSRTSNVKLFTQHSIRQVFIPFDQQGEETLKLYRELLQSGVDISRGIKRTLPVEIDESGLKLKGIPVWQLAGGDFVATYVPPSGGQQVQNLTQISDALFERLLTPFSGEYQDATRLIISPDGMLSYLPFETLTQRGTSILEAIDIAYVQSIEVYAELNKRAELRMSRSSNSLLSVAAPRYFDIDVSQSSSAEAWATLQWPSLPGTKSESDAIISLYKSNHQLLDEKASKKSLDNLQKNNKLKDYQILHFATHGYVDDERSALVLSADKTPISRYLQDQDIAGWTLNSELTLLSACNTGIGRQQKGEGIVGLPYAFFLAGNINTLMSLWPVDDTGTATFIPAFVLRIRNGEDHVTALNNTKRAFARGEYGNALKSQRIWAAFVLYGIPLSKQLVR